MKNKKISVLCGLALLALSGGAEAADRHAGYYYPTPQQIEVYKARTPILADANPIRRIAFVTAITHAKLKRPYPPSTVYFAKGQRAQKLIIVSLKDGQLDTVYRVRAFLASLTAIARTTPAFSKARVTDNLTFFDLVRMLGFEQITISDGQTYTHQVKFE